jgi:hypothetical protein
MADAQSTSLCQHPTTAALMALTFLVAPVTAARVAHREPIDSAGKGSAHRLVIRGPHGWNQPFYLPPLNTVSWD